MVWGGIIINVLAIPDTFIITISTFSKLHVWINQPWFNRNDTVVVQSVYGSIYTKQPPAHKGHSLRLPWVTVSYIDVQL